MSERYNRVGSDKEFYGFIVNHIHGRDHDLIVGRTTFSLFAQCVHCDKTVMLYQENSTVLQEVLSEYR